MSQVERGKGFHLSSSPAEVKASGCTSRFSEPLEIWFTSVPHRGSRALKGLPLLMKEFGGFVFVVVLAEITMQSWP